MGNFQIILATSDGRIQTVNINTGFLVADFPPDAHFSVGITNLQQTPAVDIVACGLADGRVHLKNLRNGEMIMSFKQDGAVTAMSFRLVFVGRAHNLTIQPLHRLEPTASRRSRLQTRKAQSRFGISRRKRSSASIQPRTPTAFTLPSSCLASRI